MENNQLVEIAESTGLEKPKVQILLEKFSSSFAEAKELAQGAKEIVVSSENQVDEMKKARDLRLSLKTVRVNVENTRKELKEQSLREGRAIDGMANIIKALIVPVEEHLEAQEKFAEKQKELRESKIEQDRISELSTYVSNVEVYKLHPADMSKDTYAQLLKTSKIAFEAQKKAEEDAKKAKVEQERIDAEKRVEMQKENERLKLEREENEKAMAIERQKVEKDRLEQEEKLKKEREAKEKLEREIKEKEEADRKQKEAEEAKKKAEREAEEKRLRDAMMAPDKEKLLKLADELETNFKLPSFSSAEAQTIGHEVLNKVNSAIVFIRQEAGKLGGDAK